MSSRAATARAREAPSTRDVILDAAERRFAERGFAGLATTRIPRTARGGLRARLSAQGSSVRAGSWEAGEPPPLGAGLYHLIFGYFADATLFEAVVQQDPRSPAAIARQRRFLKSAVAQLLGLRPARRVLGRRA